MIFIRIYGEAGAVLFCGKNISAGLYVGNGSYVYLALEGAGENVKVSASSSAKLPPSITCGGSLFSASDGELKNVFRFVADSAKLSRGCRVNFAVPMNASLLRVAAMPGLTRDEARKAFRYEVDRYFPFSMDDCVFDLDEIDYPAGGGSCERRFVVSAARRAQAEAVYSAARSCGMRFAAMEPEQVAIERAAAPVLEQGKGCVYVYAGVENLLVVFSWHRRGIFYRNKAIAFDGAAGSLDESAAALTEEVRGSVEFGLSRNEGFKFDEIFLFGPGASGRLRAALGDRFPEHDVNVIFPERRFGLDFPYGEGWTAALGLALREYDG